ncbi:long-chain-fatty-acid--CoA ligase [Phenylobacterium sp.]|uniref:class I adenylate-forming enzyme family protein n=1 Tax=Phenylobacterium sp. TaxID=1871053 RepID=UPI00301B7EE4
MLLHEPFDFHGLSRPDSDFAICDGQRLSYGQAKTRSERMSAALHAAGVGEGGRFGVLMRNAPDFLLILLAASRVGAVPVPLNYRLAPREWVDLMVDAGATLIIADPEFAEAFDTIPVSAGLKRLCATGRARGWTPLEDALTAVAATPPAVTVSSADIAFQMYTSGTTGRAKGALISQRAIVSNLIQSNLAAPHKLSPGERALLVLPLFHVAAMVTALGAACSGACLVIHRDVDPTAIARALAEDEIVLAIFVPAVIQFLLVGVPGLDRMRFPHLKALGYGASPIAEPVLRRALEVFDCHIYQGFGMTELAGGCTNLSEADHRRAVAGRPDLLLSAGRALPGCEIQIVGPDDEPLPAGVTGELIVRGEILMSGYWNMPEATTEALRGGWLHTGDAGYLDAEGYLFIRDRIKDMIVSGAENVYPAEVEGVLYKHPAVAEAAVIGVPDARWGEMVMAVIVAKPDAAVTQDQLDVFCRDHLGGFKVPRRYEFLSALPRNASGKILKRELREQYWSGHDRRVS